MLQVVGRAVGPCSLPCSLLISRLLLCCSAAHAAASLQRFGRWASLTAPQRWLAWCRSPWAGQATRSSRRRLRRCPTMPPLLRPTAPPQLRQG